MRFMARRIAERVAELDDSDDAALLHEQPHRVQVSLTRFGMSPRQVQGHQFAAGEYSPPLGHDCAIEASGVATEYGSNWLVVWMRGVTGTGKLDTPNMVRSIALYGPNAVLWQAACA
jgi:hypothetical protein